MHIVPLISVPYTGHWFLMAFLRELRIIRHEVEITALRANRDFLTLPNNGPAGVRPDRANLVHGPLRELDMGLVSRLCAWWQPISPLRDPLATLISARNRRPKEDLQWLLERWALLLSAIRPVGAHFIPLDLLRDVEARRVALEALLAHAGLVAGQDAEPLIRLWALKWPKHDYNSRGAYSLKVAYLNRDMKYIEKHGNLGAELQGLRALEGALRPFLVQHGYRELLWWTPGGAEVEDAA